MTLEQLGALLQAHGATVTVYYASDTSLDAFRAIAQQNPSTAGDFMLVNYERAALGQAKTGHISPIAAYNAKTDRLLVLDVASYKYPPVWVSSEALWKAMNTVDSASGRSRGFAIVRRTSRRRWLLVSHHTQMIPTWSPFQLQMPTWTQLWKRRRPTTRCSRPLSQRALARRFAAADRERWASETPSPIAV
jgi:hypothetical protein